MILDYKNFHPPRTSTQAAIKSLRINVESLALGVELSNNPGGTS